MDVNIIIGSDHAGYDLKEACVRHLQGRTDAVLKDAGVFDRQSADYPEVAHEIAEAVAGGGFDRGILICGTGLGMSIAANRHRGVRAALCHNLYTVRMSRLHNDANILVMGGRVTGMGLALEMVDLFLDTEFEEGRHLRRVSQIDARS